MGNIECTVWCVIRTQVRCQICGYHHLPLLAAKKITVLFKLEFVLLGTELLFLKEVVTTVWFSLSFKNRVNQQCSKSEWVVPIRNGFNDRMNHRS